MRFFAPLRTTTAYNAGVDGTFELFDHTADMGILVRASTQEGLVAPAVAGLYAAIGELKADPSQSRPFQFQAYGCDDAILLRDFLTELLVLFERDRHLLVRLHSADFHDGQIRIEGSSAPIDSENSTYCREVKAITYHELVLQKINDVFEAKLIVDI